jgi:hypothetical protein
MLCQSCELREATQSFAQDEMSFIHGMSQQWCDHCVISTQLDFARKSAERIPELEEALRKLNEPE